MLSNVASIINRAKNVYLNRGGVSDAQMLLIVAEVYIDLQHTLIENDVPVFNKIFDPITVPINAISIPPGGQSGQLPNNFYEPVFLEERQVGGTDADYIPMTERRNLPVTSKSPTLIYWSFNEEEIQLIGSTSPREVRIHGLKLLEPLTKLEDLIKIRGADVYIAAQSAANCALTVMQNPTLAGSLAMIAKVKLDKLLNRFARKNQSLPVRRKGQRRRGH